MFDPAGPQITVPVLLDPAIDGRLAEIVTGPLALDPLEDFRFPAAVLINATPFHGRSLLRASDPSWPSTDFPSLPSREGMESQPIPLDILTCKCTGFKSRVAATAPRFLQRPVQSSLTSRALRKMSGKA